MKETIVMTSFRYSKKLDAMVERIAAAQGQPKSKVLRDLLAAGLQARGYMDGGESLPDLVQQAVDAALQPHVDRLASISAKAAHISAASFFLNYSTLRQLVPEESVAEFDELATRARKLGAEYLRLSREKNIDQFLSRGLTAMNRAQD